MKIDALGLVNNPHRKDSQMLQKEKIAYSIPVEQWTKFLC